MGKKEVGKTELKKTSHFEIDCTKPVEDGVLATGSFVEFLRNRIKI